MALPISDAVVVDVLRRVDRLTAPLVRRLGRPPELPQAQRDQWWAHRVSRIAAVRTAVTELVDLMTRTRAPLAEPPDPPREQRG